MFCFLVSPFLGSLKSFNLVWVSLRRTSYDTTFASRKKKRASQPVDFVRFDCIYEVIWWIGMGGNSVISPPAVGKHGSERG